MVYIPLCDASNTKSHHHIVQTGLNRWSGGLLGNIKAVKGAGETLKLCPLSISCIWTRRLTMLKTLEPNVYTLFVQFLHLSYKKITSILELHDLYAG